MNLRPMNLVQAVLGGSLFLTLAVPKAAPSAPDGGRGHRYEVTIQNLTAGQILSPVLVAVHDGDVAMFHLGEPSSPELALLAEEGDNSHLMVALAGEHGVADVEGGADVLMPGHREQLLLDGGRHASYLSLAAMLVTTNDAFAGADSIPLPKGKDTVVHDLYAYDAGSEFNSESCAFVPGPPCGSGGSHDSRPAEGFVHVHSGIHGVGDLQPAQHDWRGPVARVSIRRAGGHD